MKKLLILLLSLIILPTIVYANGIKTEDLNFLFTEFSPTENPVTYNYFKEYADMLRSKLDFKRIKTSWVIEYRYKLHTDGTITDLISMPLNYPREGTELDEYFRNWILDNPPPPYPKDMEIGDVYVEVVLETHLKTVTEVNYYWDKPKALYPGNKVDIYMCQKTLPNVIRGFINSTIFR